jgi:hypothetical protein
LISWGTFWENDPAEIAQQMPLFLAGFFNWILTSPLMAGLSEYDAGFTQIGTRTNGDVV